ncbi:unnamed protein product [Trichobilharzia regenti]|nr:unnamed protein product [Trichobilharzia regenti]
MLAEASPRKPYLVENNYRLRNPSQSCKKYQLQLTGIKISMNRFSAVYLLTITSIPSGCRYVDLLIDLAELLNEHKIKYVLSKLKSYAQLSPSQFTVLSFTRVLQSLTLWEILLPATTVAIDFIRMRVLDMSIEEYLDWLCEAHPKVKSYILHENEAES